MVNGPTFLCEQIINKVQVQKRKGNMDEDDPMDMWPYKIQYSKELGQLANLRQGRSGLHRR